MIIIFSFKNRILKYNNYLKKKFILQKKCNFYMIMNRNSLHKIHSDAHNDCLIAIYNI